MIIWIIEWRLPGKRWHTTALTTGMRKTAPMLLERAKVSLPSDAEVRIAQYKRVEGATNG